MTAAERAALVSDLIALCAIDSPSRSERAVADRVGAELRACGLEVAEDASATATGSDCGNLLARIPGPAGAPTVLLCAHLDTVPATAPIEPELVEGRISNRNDGILGADNKAAVAVLLAVARRYGAGGAPVGVELLLTTCEEIALLGAKELGHELRADYGYVLDHATPIGELVVAAPSYYRIEAHMHGAAAHAGIRPEDGRNAVAAMARAVAAMELGRLDERTTANVGTIAGGTAANVVAERCSATFEARSLDEDRAGAVVTAIVDALTEAASDLGCDVETSVEQLFRAYSLPRSAPAVRAAAAALEALGIEPRPIATGGGSDANVLVGRGIPVVNVANGTERNHEPDESVTVDALATAYEVVLGILARADDRG
ncbi:MAG: M20/M25/M40 family metallo-hydrolase [Solirubrobacterales bacterium]|nr:M20/M25/M40 family metallo-hydrolase [Solirubrobacterales bacterium]